MTLGERTDEDRGEIEAAALDAVLRVISPIARRVRPGADVRGRIKTLLSRAGKRRRRDGARGLDDIGVRVIVRDIADCYSMITLVHARFCVLQREFDDYVAWPKRNGYQSLHTTILAPNGHPVELQVRTRAMHAIAEVGSASHQLYKQGGRVALSSAR